LTAQARLTADDATATVVAAAGAALLLLLLMMIKIPLLLYSYKRPTLTVQQYRLRSEFK